MKSIMGNLSINHSSKTQCLSTIIIFIITSGGSILTYHEELWGLFYVSYFGSGFTMGMLVSQVVASSYFKKRNGRVPYVNITKSTPIPNISSLVGTKPPKTDSLSTTPRRLTLSLRRKTPSPILLDRTETSNFHQPDTNLSKNMSMSLESISLDITFETEETPEVEQLSKTPVSAKRKLIYPEHVSLSPLATEKCVLFLNKTPPSVPKLPHVPGHPSRDGIETPEVEQLSKISPKRTLIYPKYVSLSPLATAKDVSSIKKTPPSLPKLPNVPVRYSTEAAPIPHIFRLLNSPLITHEEYNFYQESSGSQLHLLPQMT